MSLLRRQPRPLTRDKGALRDTRLFIIACDDTYAPRQYFDFFRLPRVQVHVVEAADRRSAAKHVLDHLLEIEHEESDERWLLLDVDHYATKRHLANLTQTLRKAKQKGVQVAMNKPCFELWLLLHHVTENEVGTLARALEVEQALRAVLGEFNKTKLKAGHYSYQSVCEATLRAERLDVAVRGGEIPQTNTARAYKILRAIIATTPASLLPAELQRLIPGAI